MKRVVCRLVALFLLVALAFVSPAGAQTFSLAPGSPTVPPPGGIGLCFAPFSADGDIYTTAFPPPTMVAPMGPPGCGLGWPGPPPPMAANVDAFATGLGPPLVFPIPPGAASFFLSVDPFSTGAVPGAPCAAGAPGFFPPDVSSEAALQPFSTDAPADFFVTCGPCPFPPLPAIAPFTQPNFQAADGNGLPAPPFFFGTLGPGPIGLVEPAPGGDDVDAFDGPPSGAWDPVPAGGDAIPDVPVYFSVDAPTAALIGASGADVFVTAGGAIVGTYFPPPAIGLDIVGGPGTDDIDALYVFDGDGFPAGFLPGVDAILFSVTPGSAIVGTPDACFGFPIGPDDILTEGTPFLLPGMICIVAAGSNIFLWDLPVCGPNPTGLPVAPEDNLDALDLFPPVPPPPTPTPTATMTGGATPTPTLTPTTTSTPTFTGSGSPTPPMTATPTFTPGVPTCTPPPPPVGPTPTPVDPTVGTKCQRAIGKEASKFVKAKVKALQKCEDKKVLGQHADTCPDAGAAVGSPAKKAADKIAKAISKLTAKIAKQCGGADKACATTGGGQEDPANLGFFATCPDFESSGLGNCTQAITTCEHIAECIECIAEEAIDQGMSSIYGSFAASAPGSALNKCQRAIGKETTKFALAKEKNILKCWDKLRKGLSVGSSTCPDLGGTPGLAAEKAAQKIKKAEEKKVAKICKACGGASKTCDAAIDTSLIVPGGAIIPGVAAADDLTPAAIGFMATCPSVTIPGATNCADLDDPDGAANTIDSLRELILCIDCVHEFKVDCIDGAARPQNQVYPCECNP